MHEAFDRLIKLMLAEPGETIALRRQNYVETNAAWREFLAMCEENETWKYSETDGGGVG